MAEYIFEIATNEGLGTVKLNGKEFRAGRFTLGEQLAIKNAQNLALADKSKTTLELEVETLAPILANRLIGSDRTEVTAEWLLSFTQEEYYQIYKFFANGEVPGESGTPNLTSQM